MRKFLVCSLAWGLAIVAINSPSFAQGRGAGLNQAARTPGMSLSGRGGNQMRLPNPSGFQSGADKGAMGRSGQGHLHSAEPHGGQGMTHSPSASGLNHSLKGRSRADMRGENANVAGRVYPTLDTNPEHIRDNRLNQAEHLRELSNANGNERLSNTADRMRQSAEQNYQRGVGSAVPSANGDSRDTASTNNLPPSNPAVVPGQTPRATPQLPEQAAVKSSWVPSWLRRK